jgi:hypothetical protein
MGAAEEAVDAAANFIGPFLNKDKASATEPGPPNEQSEVEADTLVEEALNHLQKINAADKAKDPNAPYDGSLVGVVYGLLDLITSLGILPFLSPGVAFSQRPRSVLVSTLSVPHTHNDTCLAHVLHALIPLCELEGSGVQPLLSQRILPDIISGVAELAFSPRTDGKYHDTYLAHYEKILATTLTSRLFPILTTYLQQGIPTWLRQRLSKELAMIPLRTHGVRHTVEFLSLSYLSKNSQMPQDAAGGSRSQIPIPLEAITQASRLLASIPAGMDPSEWFTQLAPQLWTLLDGTEGVELSRAAGQIIAGGILNRRSTGAPGTIGWELFARPILRALDPECSACTSLRQGTSSGVMVEERELELALKRVNTIAASWSHSGLLKRLIGPVLLPLWGLMEYAKSRPSLDSTWSTLPRNVITRYFNITCDPKQVDLIATNMFWDGGPSWTFGPGSQGGVEIRARENDKDDMASMGGLFTRIGQLDDHVKTFVSLLYEAKVDDDIMGDIFSRVTKRWLLTGQAGKVSKTSLMLEDDVDPLASLADAKLSEAMVTKFKDTFARSPRHIMELMSQLLQNFVHQHMAKSKDLGNSKKPNLRALKNLVKQQSQGHGTDVGSDTESEELVSFAISILNTLITSSDFKPEASTSVLISRIVPALQYISQAPSDPPISPLLTNASLNLLKILQPSATTQKPEDDPLSQHRTTLRTALTDLTSAEAPNRTWALSVLRKLIHDPTTFPLIDVPSTTYLLLSASVADPESYVHTAAIPVLVDLTVRAPTPTFRILIDAFIDIDERSLRLKKEQDIIQALDFRLRVGEILNNFVLQDEYWIRGPNVSTRFSNLKMIVDAVLSVASRRGQRKQTLSQRATLEELERKQNEEAEAAWGGPIPNLLDPEAENPVEQRERDALLKIVQGWEDTGIEEDVRVRASSLSILSQVMEKRLELLDQLHVDAGLQMVLQILVIETAAAKAILRRAAVLVAMGLLRGMDELLERGKESAAGMGIRQTEEVEKVMRWLRDEDGDELVRGHAENVVEALETWRMKKLFKLSDEQFKIGASSGLEGNLQGLAVNPTVKAERQGGRRPIVEEIE